MNLPVLNPELLAAAVERLPSDALTEMRRSALSRVVDSGLPGTSEEDWKYTNLAPASDISNSWLASGANARNHDDRHNSRESQVLSGVDAHWLVLADGQLLSTDPLAALENAGVAVQPLSKSLPDVEDDISLDSLNLALLRDGLRITASSACSLDKPIGLLITGDNSAGTVAQERIVINVEDSATLQLLECHLSDSGQPAFTNIVQHIKLGQDARLDHVRLQFADSHFVLTGRTRCVLNKDSIYDYASYDFGGKLIRNDIIADIREPGAVVNLNGLYLAENEQHIDNHTVVNHFVGPAHSNEEFRGILNGHSRCVFNGKAIVHEGADGTDAQQSNHNLLLSESAEIDTKPELEIYADDVKCSHGATVGQLDKASLFYLRSRGLTEDAAVQMLTRAFASGVVERCPLSSCKDVVSSMLDEKLGAMAVGR